MEFDTHDEIVSNIIDFALKEDLGKNGDVTSNSLFDSRFEASALIKSKQQGILAGSRVLIPIFHKIDPSLTVNVAAFDGSHLNPGTEICRLHGSIRSILAGERTALNFLQRLSGIATKTSEMVSLLKGTGTKLLDTRKTTPGLRILEKMAVAAGGGVNHRFGLYDMVLIKDTHVAAAGGPGRAVKAARQSVDKALKIEVEIQSFEEFIEAAKENPDRIMLDNMSITEMSRCINWLHEHSLKIETEASGNITEKTIASIASTGVDFISSGAITHSVSALDIHLIIV